MNATSQQKTMPVHLSLVVLCYRAGREIVPFVERLHQMLKFLNCSYELVLVGNYVTGAEDETPKVVKELEQTMPHTRAVVLPKEGMMGWDMRSGMDAARGDIIGVIDGDGQFPIEAIVSCLLRMELEGCDLVKTYRVGRQDGFYRRLISSVYNALFGLLFGTPYRDVNSKPKLIRRSAYEKMRLSSNDWFTDAEIMIWARRLGLNVGEIPTLFYRISSRASFVKPSAIIEFIRNLIEFRFFNKQLKG